MPAAALDTLVSTFRAALARIAAEGIDMIRMSTIIERQRLQLLESIETDAAEVLSQTILTDAIFGHEDGSDLGTSLKSMQHYNVLDTWTSAEWSSLLAKYYVDARAITIIGRPSAALADRLEQEEKARVAATVARLGPAGLAQLAKEVEDAQAENDQPVPSEVIRQFAVPDVNGIEWIQVDSAQSQGVAQAQTGTKNRVQDHVNADATELPLFVQFSRECDLTIVPQIKG